MIEDYESDGGFVRKVGRSVLIEWKGETKTATEWANQIGMKRVTLIFRLTQKMPLRFAMQHDRVTEHKRPGRPRKPKPPKKPWRTHGMSKTPTYVSWHSMINRCKHACQDSFRYYGSVGVTVCERWHTFANFLADMGERPEGTSIDRIDPSGNYEPNNCRWATPQVQYLNQRKRGTVAPFVGPKMPSQAKNSMGSTHGKKFEAYGLSLTGREWAKKLGVSRQRIYQMANTADSSGLSLECCMRKRVKELFPDGIPK